MLNPLFNDVMDEIKNDQLAPLLITILVGANDACFSAPWVYVPLERFEINIRHWVDTILRNPSTRDTKIVLLATPPINQRSPSADGFIYGDSSPKERVGFRTYMSKKRYAAKVMEIARSYQEKTDRVAGLDVWKLMVNDALQREGRAIPATESDEYDEDTLPGSSLPNAKMFPQGFFIDGLHLGKLVSNLF
jgi:isoamyl acetate esterase